MTRDSLMSDANRIAALATDFDTIASVNRTIEKNPQARLMLRRAVAALWEAFAFAEAASVAFPTEEQCAAAKPGTEEQGK
jgi:hypothetical protein